MRRFTVLAAASLVALALLAASPRAATAHPLGRFTVPRYARIELYSDQIRVTYILDYAELPTYQVVAIADANHDGDVSGEEGAAYAAKAAKTFAQGMTLRVDGVELELRVLESHFQMVAGQAGLPTVRVGMAYAAPAPAGGIVGVEFEDRNDEGPGWKEIVVRPSAGAQVQVDPDLLIDRSNALTSYPVNDLQSAPDMRQVSFEWAAGTGQPAPTVVQTATPKRSPSSGDGLSRLVDKDGSFWLIVLAMLAAFGFGSLHALGPGHGKTVVASYLVGGRGTFRHAVVLGCTTTATHTASVYLLGFVTIAASAWIVPSTLYLYLSVGSGALVVVTGFALFIGRVRRRGGHSHEDEGTHRHGPSGRAHSHKATQVADHGHAAAGGSEDSRMPDHNGGATGADSATGVSWRSLFALGVAGGMLPCPSAIVVMLAAIAIGKVVFGLLLIVCFSLGLASVLTTLGILVVAGQRLASRSSLMRAARYPAVRRFVAAMPALSALGVMLAGVAITVLALRQPGL